MPHAQHLTNPLHGNWDCDQCHIKPTDVLSEKHVFDDSPAKAEVDFSQGLSATGVYDGNGGCSNLYCHGSGKVTGSYRQDDVKPDCTGCHSSSNLQGRHRKHLREGVACGECHSSVASGSNTVINGDLHVNGQIDVLFQNSNMNRASNRCTGSCHGEYHGGETW
jgi:predicted CxxxxCH...CXXCH cytochrome family protein